MSIEKKSTTDLKHYGARTITNIQILPGEDEGGNDTPIIAFISDRGGSHASERVLPMSPEAWQRAAMGAGASLAALREGLNMASRYRFKIMTEMRSADPTNEDAPMVETVVGVHCIPDDNYIRCNFGLTLNRPNITEDMAVVQIHENSGELDVIAFPEAFRRNVDSFVAAIEKMVKVDNTTSFTDNGITYTIVNAFGNEVSFRCTRAR